METPHPLEHLMDQSKSYLSNRQELARLEIVDKGSLYLSKIIAIFFYSLLGLFGLLLAAIALGRYFNSLLQSEFQGFFLASLVMLLLLGAFWLGRKFFFGRVMRNAIIKVWLDADDHDTFK